MFNFAQIRLSTENTLLYWRVLMIYALIVVLLLFLAALSALVAIAI
jgi:hypothetical protein